MKCTIYRSNKKDLTYLYVPSGVEDFEGVPEALLKMVQPLEQIMELELSPERKLASEDVSVVIEKLNEQGWFLQYPPDGGERTEMLWSR